MRQIAMVVVMAGLTTAIINLCVCAIGLCRAPLDRSASYFEGAIKSLVVAFLLFILGGALAT